MNLFLVTFEAVIILLGIGLIGFFIMKTKILPITVLRSLNPLALDIALPSLIFVDIISDFTPSTYPDWWQYPLWWMVFTLFAAAATFLFSYLSKKETKNEFAVSLFYQNGLFFPLAILTGMFAEPEGYVIPLFLFILFFPAFFFSTYPFFFKDKMDKKMGIPLKKILHPTLFATLIGIAISLIGIKQIIPDVLESILSMLGAMTIPLLMIILGGNIYVNYKKAGFTHRFETAKFILIKNFVFPLCFIGFLLLFYSSIPPTIAFIMFLQSAVPPVTAIPLVTARMKGNSELTSQFVMTSFIVSLFSLPLMVYIYLQFFAI